MRTKVAGVFCVLIGVWAAWKNFAEGRVGFALAAVTLALAGAYYFVRPSNRVLGGIEVLWGVMILVYFLQTEGGIRFDNPRASGATFAAGFGLVLIFVGLRNLVRKPKTAGSPRPS